MRTVISLIPLNISQLQNSIRGKIALPLNVLGTVCNKTLYRSYPLRSILTIVFVDSSVTVIIAFPSVDTIMFGIVVTEGSFTGCPATRRVFRYTAASCGVVWIPITIYDSFFKCYSFIDYLPWGVGALVTFCSYIITSVKVNISCVYIYYITLSHTN